MGWGRGGNSIPLGKLQKPRRGEDPRLCVISPSVLFITMSLPDGWFEYKTDTGEVSSLYVIMIFLPADDRDDASSHLFKA